MEPSIMDSFILGFLINHIGGIEAQQNGLPVAWCSDYFLFIKEARVAELADALDSGSSE
jgi:hypothetical protein